MRVVLFAFVIQQVLFPYFCSTTKSSSTSVNNTGQSGVATTTGSGLNKNGTSYNNATTTTTTGCSNIKPSSSSTGMMTNGHGTTTNTTHAAHNTTSLITNRYSEDEFEPIGQSLTRPSYLLTGFGIGLHVHTKTGRVLKTKNNGKFDPFIIRRHGDFFSFKSKSGYLSLASLQPSACFSHLSNDKKPQMDWVVANSKTPTDWSIFIHLPDQRILLAHDKSVISFKGKYLVSSPELKDAKLFKIANVKQDTDDTVDQVYDKDNENNDIL